jgi:anti-sigma factor RsiW
MNPIDDNNLQAYVDGELDAASAARIDAALVQDDLLARRVQKTRALRAQLTAAFDPVLEEMVPACLVALLQSKSPQATTRTDTACGGAGLFRQPPWPHRSRC